MQEFELYRQWQSLTDSGAYPLANGQVLQVIHSGKLNTARGPDFRSARFILNGVTYQGDVECHVRAEDWYRHQHHLDPAFANVLLHVIAPGQETSQPVTHTLSSDPIPTVSLPSFRSPQTERVCAAGSDALPVIHALGRERFLDKSRRLEHLLHTFSAERIFYDMGLTVLGYGGNETGFRMLARHLPWSWFNRFIQTHSQQTIEAVCLGQAGLLHNTPAYSAQLNALFKACQPALEYQPLPGTIWQFAGIRPQNYPSFRLAGWSTLYSRQARPFSTLYERLCDRLPLSELQRFINAFFQFPCPPYWQTHYSFQKERPPAAGSRYCFGVSRINEFLINLVLPLAYALARQSGSAGFAEYVLAFYAGLRQPGLYGRLKRTFPGLASVRRIQAMQGLLHLQQHYCFSKACGLCPLNGKKH